MVLRVHALSKTIRADERGARVELKKLSHDLTVCKVRSLKNIYLDADFFFIGKTDEEISLICKTEDTPEDTIEREDGWIHSMQNKKNT